MSELRQQIAKICREVLHQDIGLKNKDLKDAANTLLRKRLDDKIEEAVSKIDVEDMVKKEAIKHVKAQVTRSGKAYISTLVKKEVDRKINKINIKIGVE